MSGFTLRNDVAADFTGFFFFLLSSNNPDQTRRCHTMWADLFDPLGTGAQPQNGQPTGRAEEIISPPL